jgi:ribonuclease BN (tRNA processing enzyme)
MGSGTARVTGEPLSLTVLGCDGSYPGRGGAGSGYLVTCGSTKVWMDTGPGTLARLQKYVDIEELDAAVVSHSHPDHWSDLDHFAVAARYVVPRPPLVVFAPEGLRELMRVGSAAVEALEWQPIGDGSAVVVGEMQFSFTQTDHPVKTLAARVDGGGRSLGYSADSGPEWGLAALGSGLNLALCEATHLSDREGTVPHMSARQAGRTARDARVERLVITHLWPRVDRAAARAEAQAAFGGEVTVAAPGDRYVA